jgi:hypothetical protein
MVIDGDQDTLPAILWINICNPYPGASRFLAQARRLSSANKRWPLMVQYHWLGGTVRSRNNPKVAKPCSFKDHLEYNPLISCMWG